MYIYYIPVSEILILSTQETNCVTTTAGEYNMFNSYSAYTMSTSFNKNRICYVFIHFMVDQASTILFNFNMCCDERQVCLTARTAVHRMGTRTRQGFRPHRLSRGLDRQVYNVFNFHQFLLKHSPNVYIGINSYTSMWV